MNTHLPASLIANDYQEEDILASLADVPHTWCTPALLEPVTWKTSLGEIQAPLGARHLWAWLRHNLQSNSGFTHLGPLWFTPFSHEMGYQKTKHDQHLPYFPTLPKKKTDLASYQALLEQLFEQPLITHQGQTLRVGVLWSLLVQVNLAGPIAFAKVCHDKEPTLMFRENYHALRGSKRWSQKTFPYLPVPSPAEGDSPWSLVMARRYLPETLTWIRWSRGPYEHDLKAYHTLQNRMTLTLGKLNAATEVLPFSFINEQDAASFFTSSQADVIREEAFKMTEATKQAETHDQEEIFGWRDMSILLSMMGHTSFQLLTKRPLERHHMASSLSQLSSPWEMQWWMKGWTSNPSLWRKEDVSTKPKTPLVDLIKNALDHPCMTLDMAEQFMKGSESSVEDHLKKVYLSSDERDRILTFWNEKRLQLAWDKMASSSEVAPIKKERQRF